MLNLLAMYDSMPGPDAVTDPSLPAEVAHFTGILNRLAVPYSVDAQGRASPSHYVATTLAPSGGLISTVLNYAEFELGLRKGVLLRSDTLGAAWRAPVAQNGRALPHGQGWFVQTYSGEPVVWQFGVGSNASSSLVMTLPSRGITLVLLANSRPWEGLVLGLPVAGATLAGLIASRRLAIGQRILRVVLPISVVLILAGAAMAYYFWCVTGSPVRMPYQVAREAYATAPIFLWQSPRAEPVHRHPVIREFYRRYELAFYEAETGTVWGLVVTKAAFTIALLAFYFGPALLLPLLMFPRLLRNRRVRFLVAAGAVGLVGLAVEVFFIPHYAAPMTPTGAVAPGCAAAPNRQKGCAGIGQRPPGLRAKQADRHAATRVRPRKP
jgi:hypothetical protein